jgi:hypothetical protein
MERTNTSVRSPLLVVAPTKNGTNTLPTVARPW